MKFSKNIDFFYSGCIIILLRKRYLDKGVEKGEIMGIKINENQNIFSIETKNTSYIFGVDNLGLIRHLYWGNKINNVNDHASMNVNMKVKTYKSHQIKTLHSLIIYKIIPS